MCTKQEVHIFNVWTTLLQSWINLDGWTIIMQSLNITEWKRFELQIMQTRHPKAFRIGTTFLWYSHIGTLVVSQSVKQCMTVDLFHIFWAMLSTLRRSTFCCMDQCWTKHPGYPLRECCKLYRLLIIHCIYVSVTKPTCPAFSAWLNTGSIRPLKVKGKDIMVCSMALPSKSCVAVHGQSYVGSVCDYKPCRRLDLSVLVEIISGVYSNHGT